MDKLIAVFSTASLFFLLFACSGPTGPKNSKIDIVGTITKVNSGAERLKILVEEDPAVHNPDKKNGEKLFLFISRETEIYKQSDSDSLIKIKSKFLKVGLKVKVWASKLVLVSYPGQTDALKIIVIDQ